MREASQDCVETTVIKIILFYLFVQKISRSYQKFEKKMRQINCTQLGINLTSGFYVVIKIEILY